jgi:sugar-specific transcriptional regulator TrmB
LFSLDENAEMLSDFGLTYNQAKVYLTIAKLGVATVSEVSKVSKVRREDVYRILPKLEKTGLIERILGKPTRLRAIPVEDALALMIKREEHIASERVRSLAALKDEFLKHFKAYKVKPLSKEAAHFALISEREGIINQELTMVKDAKKSIDVLTSKDKLFHIFGGYLGQFEKAFRSAVKVRVILDVSDYEDSILKIIEENKRFGDNLDIRYTDQPIGHCVIRDYTEALMATSREPTVGDTPCLWTDAKSLVGLLQKNFESTWHASVDVKTIQTEDVPQKIEQFLKSLRPTNHVIFVYNSLEAKHKVLFNYLRSGLENGEAAAYVTSEENPKQIRDAMKRLRFDVEKYEKTGALKILGYKDIYIIDGKFSITTTMNLWKKLYSEALKQGFNGLRVTGEMTCFFQHNLVEQLVEYERALHRVLDVPIIAACAYNANTVMEASNPIDLYNELLKAHGKILFTGIDDKLGKIEIRQA